MPIPTPAPVAATAEAVKKHPAGTTAGAGGVLGGLLISTLHLSPEAAGAVCAAIGLAATAVSYLNSHGGLRGLYHEIVDGNAEA